MERENPAPTPPSPIGEVPDGGGSGRGSDPSQNFWNTWAEVYRGFSETVEPYREAQRVLAQALIAALGESGRRETLVIVDVGGGAGNLISHLLETLALQRGHRRGVIYVLTDSAKTMLALAQKRWETLRHSYPTVEFRAIEADTLGDHFIESLREGSADIVVSSWNIEYYQPEIRQEIVTRLARLAQPQGVIGFSSIVRLPEALSIREVLTPLGQAQIMHALLTGGPRRLRQVITGFKQVSQFGPATSVAQFPEKPTLAELKEMAQRADLGSVSGAYHLYGASGMVIARKDSAPLPELSQPAIAQVLTGKEGYEGHSEAINFWGYLQALLRGQRR